MFASWGIGEILGLILALIFFFGFWVLVLLAFAALWKYIKRH
jgi:hypothetical protein